MCDLVLPNPRPSLGRSACLYALSLVALVAVARVAQLAMLPGGEGAGGANVSRGVEGEPFPGPSLSGRGTEEEELAELYAMCPCAAVVDWEEVARSPQEAEAQLLPPVRETAATVPNPPTVTSHRPIPTVRYPEPVRVALRPGPRYRVAESGEWLVDPGDWFMGKERTDSPVAPTAEPEPPSDAPTNPIAPVPTDSEPLEVAPSTVEPIAETPAPAAESEAWPGGAYDLGLPDIEEPGTPAMEPETEFVAPVGQAPESTTPLFPPPTVSHENPEPLPLPVQTPASPAAPIFAPPTDTDSALPPPAHASEPNASGAVVDGDGPVDPHLELFAKNNYPSARECATCHEDIYHQWSVSAHAYANISPMFHKFEQKINDISQGTIGYFCMRCHAPVATSMCYTRDTPIWNLPEVAREGITCIVCHRVKYMYGKSNGERRIEPGPIFAPVYGGVGGDGVAEVIHQKDEFKVKTSPDEKGPGQDIHVTGIYFDQLTRSEFCASCHQVAVHPGIKLEVVWEQYRASPACKKGIQCQDCHMGTVPGLPLGYDCGPVAKIADKTVNDHRRRSNHIFYGPNYSIAHPGIFPFHLKANRWTIEQWLEFDWRAGWGTDEFEDAVADGRITAHFPPVWAEADDRYDAREIIEENFKKLNHKREIRTEIMENGMHIDGPFFDTQPCRGQDLKLHFIVTNTNEGHNVLTASLGAQPQLWANIVVVGPDGQRVWETGYTDSYGDLANIHSVDVRHGRAPFDWQLFNLQTMFLITGVKGTDREFFLPVNIDIDQLPFIRPGVQPISVINHPPFIRMESQSLAPLGSRKVPYRVPGKLLSQPGPYRLTFRMRSRAEPPYFMRFCDATPDMLRSMNEWMVDIHPMSVEFYVR